MKTKIVVAGIGGVGGFFGGLLAKAFFGGDKAEIVFLARGEHLKRVREHGLKIITKTDEFVAKPALATDDANGIGIADFILICVKSYDLEQTIGQLKPCIGPETVIIPFLNGVDSPDKIKALLPDNTVAGGCVYIVSSINEPGVVRNSGNIQSLYFGLDNARDEKLQTLQSLLLEAGIESTLTENISAVMWEKFHLVAANSTATSFFSGTTGELLADPSKEEILSALLEEVNRVALAKGVVFDKEMVSATMLKIRSFPFEATSSMQRDFWKKDGKTELETITGYVARAGKELNVPTPTFDLTYNALVKAPVEG